MNRKTLVLAAAAMGLLAPVLAACGDTESGSGDGDAIVVGTTDRFTASEEEGLAPSTPPGPTTSAPGTSCGRPSRPSWSSPAARASRCPTPPSPAASPTPNNERYSCTLRDGLKFSNGDPITAQDVKYSIDRAISLEGDSGVFALLSTVDTVETQGDNEVIFHLKAADATFPYKLSTPVAAIVNKDDYAQNKLREGFDIDGSGPYTMEAKVEDGALVRATFTKNPSYKGALQVNNDKVEMVAYDSADAMGDALKDGEIDVMTRSMSPEQIQELSNATDGEIELVETPGLEIRYLAFNTKAESVEDKAVRQAMAQVINRDELVGKVYGSQAEPLFSLVPMASPTTPTPSSTSTATRTSPRPASCSRTPASRRR